MPFLPIMLAVVLVGPATATADVFKWVDGSGVAHYTFDRKYAAAPVDVAAGPAAVPAEPSASARALRAQLALAQLPAPREIPPARRIPGPRPREARALLPGRVTLIPKLGYGDIQLASLRSAGQAWYEWIRLRDRHDDLLDGLDPYVVPVDLGARGRFFRLRAGPVADTVTLCNRLSVRRIACLSDLPD